jgi:predicted transcriptional regulator
MTNEQAAAILKELEMLRKIKMAELLRAGLSQEELAQILGVSQPTVSRMAAKLGAKKKARQQ